MNINTASSSSVVSTFRKIQMMSTEVFCIWLISSMVQTFCKLIRECALYVGFEDVSEADTKVYEDRHAPFSTFFP